MIITTQEVKHKVLCINLLRDKAGSSEGRLSDMFKGLVENSAMRFLNEKQSEIGYIHYDFHAACHKNTDPYDLFVDSLFEKWIGPQGVFKETFTRKFDDPDTTRNEINSIQTGVIRTNCLDCLDRTNIGKMKISLKVI
jgi:hypothetical protein